MPPRVSLGAGPKFRRLVGNSYRWFFGRAAGIGYPPVKSTMGEAYKAEAVPAVAGSIARSGKADALYAWRFARVPGVTIRQWAEEHGRAPDLSPAGLSVIAEHVQLKHVLHGEPAHGEAEMKIVEEFLHHETVKDTPFFWLDNNCSYFKRIGFTYMHIKRRSMARRSSIDPWKLNGDDVRRLVTESSQDPVILDTFLFCLSVHCFWSYLRQCSLPIIEAIWKEPGEARDNYGIECGRACEMIEQMTTLRDEQLEIAKALLNIPMDWLKGLYPHMPANCKPMNRLVRVHEQMVAARCSVEDCMSGLEISKPAYRNTKIGYWYFGLLPDDLLWFYLHQVILTRPFIWHALRTGFVFRFIRMLFRHGQILTYPVPALLVETKDEPYLYEPGSSREMPGFGFERLLGNEGWLVSLYAYLISLSLLQVDIARRKAMPDFFKVFLSGFWQNVGVSTEELEILNNLYLRIAGARALRERLATFVEADQVSQLSQLSETFQAVETEYWSLLEFSRRFDERIVRKALGHFYLHGYV
jgi:hypothetical protein